MAVFSFFNRKSAFALQAQLSLLGAVCGALYALIFFGFGKTLLLLAALAGGIIVLLYSILEFHVFASRFKKLSLTNQFAYRVTSYSVLFLFAFCLISFLHASYSYQISGDPVQIILAEDYFPFWPNYLFYAILSAIVFQSLWLLNAVNAQNANLNLLKEGEVKKIKATVLVMAVRSKENTSPVNEELVIKILNLLCKKIQSSEENTIAYFENDKLKICIKHELNLDDIKHWEQILYKDFESHISKSQKMLQLYIGFSKGVLYLQKCGSQIIFYGETVHMAEHNLKPISAINSHTVELHKTVHSVIL
jgi:hypothetical protein